MRPKHKRMIIIISVTSIMVTAGLLILNNFRDNLVYFYAPSEIYNRLESQKLKTTKLIRAGGLVVEGSIKKIFQEGSEITEFEITDLKSNLKIQYKGILPPMFRENQGVVAEGHIADIDGSNNGNKIFIAEKLLTKHDEKYMPPEVHDALKAK